MNVPINRVRNPAPFVPLISMGIVGQHLAAHAGHLGVGSPEFDIFGRSAFNRYYYATYLVVRSTLFRMRPEWAKKGHSQIPEFLRGKFREVVNEQIKKLVKKGAITMSDGGKIKGSIFEQATNLANLMDTAYGVRVVADYEPEIKTTLIGNMALSGTTIGSAQRWPEKAHAISGFMIASWRELG